MADRFQDRPLPDDLDRIDPRGRGQARGGGEGDPLAELARLIGQNDPFGGGGAPPGMGRANAKMQPRAPAPDPYRAQVPPPSPVDDSLSAGPPPWMSGGGRPEAPRRPPHVEPDFQQPEAAVHPVHRYGAEQMPPQPQYRDDPSFDDRQPDQARYDDALFGQIDGRGQGFGREQPFPDDPYAFQDEGYDEAEEDDEPRRGNGLAKVAVVLALAVIGTGAAFAYRTYMGSSRSGEPPIIRADNAPTKIITAVPSDGITKLPDRMATGDQGEKIVSREETPMDVNSRSIGGPRVVFPPLNQSSGGPAAPGQNLAANDTQPTSATPMADSGGAPTSGGTLANGEPRRIKTLSVHGDQGDGMSPQAAATAPAAAAPKAVRTTRNSPSQANASANTPMSISPQPAAAPAADKRMAAATPAPDAGASAPAAAGMAGYLVQVSSQRSEADAQTSFRALKTKYADVMGSYSPVIKRVDITGKGVMYRAMVGPFDTADAANQFCNSLKTAGGQCLIQRN